MWPRYHCWKIEGWLAVKRDVWSSVSSDQDVLMFCFYLGGILELVSVL